MFVLKYKRDLDYTDKILQLVADSHDKTNGSCGLSVNEIMRELGVEYQTVKSVLNEMFISKRIKIRKGINGVLIFKQ